MHKCDCGADASNKHTPATAKEKAVHSLVSMLTEDLPVKLTEDQHVALQDKAYDFVSALLEAVYDEYNVTSKR